VVDHLEPGLQRVGPDLQGPDDHCRRHRPLGPPLRHPGVLHDQLSLRGCEEARDTARGCFLRYPAGGRQPPDPQRLRSRAAQQRPLLHGAQGSRTRGQLVMGARSTNMALISPAARSPRPASPWLGPARIVVADRQEWLTSYSRAGSVAGSSVRGRVALGARSASSRRWRAPLARARAR
jgi:hypothetical protein